MVGQSESTDMPSSSHGNLLTTFVNSLASLEAPQVAANGVNFPSAFQNNIQHRRTSLDLNEPPELEEQRLVFDLNEVPQNSHNEMSSDESDGELVTELLSYSPELEEDEYQWTDSESDSEHHGEEQLQQTRKRQCTELSNIQRKNVANRLQQLSQDNKLLKGSINNLAKIYKVSRWSISRIWQRIKPQMIEQKDICIVNLKTGKVGRKRAQLDLPTFKATPLHKRTTIRAAAKAIGMHKSTLHRLLKRGEIKRHSSSVKLDLTEAHKSARVKWCLKAIVPSTIKSIPQFRNMYNIIHVDEKWFCLSKVSQRYLLAPDESNPHRRCKSKKFIKKVMFLGAVARPHLMPSTNEVIWDGKIGIFTFVDLVAAKRKSKNRDKGTIETKATTSITKRVIKDKLIQELLPAIRDKWPSYACKTIWIQQDNARPHIAGSDEQFFQEAQKDGFDMHLVNQLPQSPDLNILDLGFFRAIQSLKEQMTVKNEENLIKAVEEAYNNYDPVLTNYIFLSLQQCMHEILKVRGNNNYVQPHMNKASLDSQGKLPVSLTIPKELVEDSCAWLQQSPYADYIFVDNSEYHTDSDSDDGYGYIEI